MTNLTKFFGTAELAVNSMLDPREVIFAFCDFWSNNEEHTKRLNEIGTDRYLIEWLNMEVED